jgi:hypothetical protein
MKFRIVKIECQDKKDIYRIQKKSIFSWSDYAPYGKLVEDFPTENMAYDSIMDIPGVKNRVSKKTVIREIEV